MKRKYFSFNGKFCQFCTRPAIKREEEVCFSWLQRPDFLTMLRSNLPCFYNLLKRNFMWSIKHFTFSPIQENTYLLWNDERDTIIIDPGCYDAEEKEDLRLFIAENQLQLRMLLNTHCHLDHVFGEKFVAATWGLVPKMHPYEEAVLKMGEAAGKMWGMPFENYSGPIDFIDASDTIQLGSDQLKILFTPGHSPGHLCFYCPAQDFIISGDVLFRGSIGRTDLPGGNFDVLLESITQSLLPLPGNTRVHSGHGPETTIAIEKKTNPFLNQRGG